MSNLAIAFEEKIALMEFVEEIYTPRTKPSILKFQRSKHPTGRGEQALNRNWYASARGMEDKREVKTFNTLYYTPPSIEEGLAEGVVGEISSQPAYAECAKDYRLMQEAEEQTHSWQQLDRYSMYLYSKGYISEQDSDWGYIPLEYFPEEVLSSEWLAFIESEKKHPFDENLDWDEDDLQNPELVQTMANAVFSYEAPQPMDQGVRTWYAGKGKAARLTQRQYTADFCKPVPEGYDPYEGDDPYEG